MPAATPISFETLESALQWSSSGAPFENEALLCRATGTLFLRSTQGDFSEELPDDIEDENSYVGVPHKNELDLGRSLILAFAEVQAPAHTHTIESFFKRRGGYAKFKAFLERTHMLERWYEYEAVATRTALEAWAKDSGFLVVKN